MGHLVLNRWAMGAFGALFIALALGFITRVNWLVDHWPWPEFRLSYIFIGAVLAAIGAIMIWLAWAEHWRAAAGGSIALLVMFGGMTASLFFMPAPADKPLLMFGLALVSVAGTAAIGLFESLRQPVDETPIPVGLHKALWLMTAVWATLGFMLLMQMQKAFPWVLRPESSIMFGWVFLGFAGNYAYAARSGRWLDAKALLIGSLAYNLILIWPLIALFAAVRSGHAIALAFYTSLSLCIASVCVFMLLFEPKRAKR